ncbi:hypothetical protein ZOSMA_27G00790 [Zostera marina]|uniref:Uncharacterized protein n=1 Tax=Zostera marina TaxID=29655 RepID=A0A0K9PDI4_ZOSMR|nr:hypothetical protein ZOSMA_27G00790 [Zostera marina]
MRDRMHHRDQQSRALNSLCALALTLIRSTPLTITDPGVRQVVIREKPEKASPTEIATLMLGISVTLMLGGWMTFFIGFFMMPWIVGLVMVLCFVGFVSNVSELGRAILFPHQNCNSSPKEKGQLRSQHSYH